MWKLMLQSYTLIVNIYLFHCNSAQGESTTHGTACKDSTNIKHTHIYKLKSAQKLIHNTHCLFSLLALYALHINNIL